MSFVSSTQRQEYLFKIIVIGDVSTGKTSLIQRYVKNVVNQPYKPTIGVDFATKVISNDNCLTRLQFWDTAGHDRFANMMRVYYRDSHAAIVVCDCSKRETVSGAFQWKKDLDYKLVLENGQPIPSVLLANKCDLKNEFSSFELEDLARQAGFWAAFKVSAKNNINIEPSMEYLLQQIMNTERDGLYMASLSKRDHNVRKVDLPNNALNWRRDFQSILKNVCC